MSRTMLVSSVLVDVGEEDMSDTAFTCSSRRLVRPIVDPLTIRDLNSSRSGNEVRFTHHED